MIQPQSWSAVKQERDIALPLPPLNTFFDVKKGVNRSKLQELDVAASLQELRVSSPRCPPSPLSDWMLVEPVHDDQPRILPSFKDGFSEVIAAADRESLQGNLSSTTGRGSPRSEYSWATTSPLSTANSSPAPSPTTPYYNISSQSQLDIQMRFTPYQDDAERKKRHLALNRLRRASSQSALRAGFDTYSPRLASNSKKLRRPASTTSLMPCGKKERHFNQKYQNPDKLFIVYCKDDLKKGWPEIQALRLRMLPMLLGKDYNRSVEENREISGLNGMYYRENDLNMPLLTPDGSGLEFVEKDGRWWECTRSQKCRTGEDRGSTKKGSASDIRPRGMVERYPEEVLEYWDDHVQHFVLKEKRAEVLARAIEYCRIRAEQREQYGVPKWALENKVDRVINMNSKKADENSTTTKGKIPRRTNLS